MKRKTFIRIAAIIFISSSVLWIFFDKGYLMWLVMISWIAILDEYRVLWQKKD